MAVTELTPDEFVSENSIAIFKWISEEVGKPYDLPHFADTWTQWMRLGIARTWADDGCILGALFTQDLFSNEPRAQVAFWFSLPEVRRGTVTGAVFRAFEAAAQAAGCIDIQSAAHEASNPLAREAGYLQNGFVKTETIFTKSLCQKHLEQ